MHMLRFAGALSLSLMGSLALPGGSGAALAFPMVKSVDAPRSPSLPVIDVQTKCDYRGCFTFGPVQSFRPAYQQPNYRPPGAPENYYRPRAAGPAPLYNNPPPVRRILPDQTKARSSDHVQWCRNQYRSYNPQTDRFISYEGVYKTCNSPYK
ncbi:BA14K family protein [Oryzifoliimicrobium ureilyticus]|uniref:BA14K family protein n=1 Tax=Oryzifoliimicrobium ureilyticus TaxID=3113724 RepID=UPI003F66FA9F